MGSHINYSNTTVTANSSDYAQDLRHTTTVDHVIRVVWLSVVFAFGTVGNLLLFAVVLRKGRITNVTNLFNMNLAIADLIRIFVFIPVYLIYSSHNEWPQQLSLPGCKAVFMVVQHSLTVSILTLMFMSMERHWAVVHPLKKQMTIRQGRYLVFVSWFLGFFSSLWFAMALKLVKEPDGSVHCGPFSEKTLLTTALLVLLVAFQWLPGAAFTIAYIKIIIKLRRDAVINPADISQSSQNRHRRNLRAARILVIEVLCFLGFLFPFYQNSFETTTGNGNPAASITPEGMLVVCMMITYSLINPLCHIFLNSDFREQVRKMYHQLKVFCGLESMRISDSSHFHLPGLHLYLEPKTRQNEEMSINSNTRS